MDLRELHVERMPGLDPPFTVTAAPGLNLILGPNGSGKSSLCRAALGLLWPGRHPGGLITGTWRDGDVTWRSERTGGDHVAWQRDGQDHSGPPVPAVSQAAAFHLGLLDLLKATSGADDRELAAAVRRQLAGGYDLTPDPIATRPGQREKKDLEAAQLEVDRCRDEQARLIREEAGLDDLRARRTAARHGQRQVRALTLAADLLRAREESANLQRQLAAGFPASMSRLHADDLTRLRALRARDLELQQEIAISGRQLAAAQADQQAQGFGDAPPTAEDLTRLRQRHARAENLQQALDDLTTELAGAEARVAAAAAALTPWGAPPDDAPLDAAELRARAAAAQSLLEHTARRDGLAHLQDQVNLTTDDDTLPDPTALDEARLATLDWLAAAAERRRPWLAAVAGALLAVAGAVQQPWLPDRPTGWDGLGSVTLGWTTLGLGAAVLVTAVVRGLRRPRTRQALARHAATGITGITGPEVWTDISVRQHLDSLDSLAEQHRDARRRDQLAAELDDLAQGAARELATVAAAHPDTDPVASLDRAEQLHRAAAYHQALQDRDALVGRRRRRTEDLTAALDEAAATLAPWRPDDTDAPADPTALGAALAELSARTERHAEAVRRAETAARNLQDQTQRSQGEQATAAELLATHGLAPDADDAFRKLVDRLPAYEQLADQTHRAATTVQVKEDELGSLPDDIRELAQDAQALSLAEVTEQLDEAGLVAGSLEELQQQIMSIETRLDAAYRRSDLDQALQREATARDALTTVRRHQREATLRHLLLTNLQQQHRRLAEPPVVSRTRELLLGFTHGAYEFLVPDDDAQVFRARDTRTGQGLTLGQLSDGTRAQLLLAARLAHVTEAERGLTLPLFLDESLTASDPARFRAVASAVLDLVAAGRQVFYLTCDPADVAAWQSLLRASDQPEAPVIDLAAVRRLPAMAAPERLRPQSSPPPVPRPDEEPSAYAARLEVAGLSAHRPATAAHLFHLLPDQLDALHGLLCRGVTHLGHLESLGELLLRDGALDHDALASLRARGRALALFLDSFVVGRGRPVPRGELERRSGIKTSKIEEADALLVELNGDAEAFRQALDDRRIKNLQQAKADELTDWLQDEGYLDPRPTSSRDEVMTQVMQGVSDDIDQGRLSMALLRELVLTWWNAADGGTAQS